MSITATINNVYAGGGGLRIRAEFCGLFLANQLVTLSMGISAWLCTKSIHTFPRNFPTDGVYGGVSGKRCIDHRRGSCKLAADLLRTC